MRSEADASTSHYDVEVIIIDRAIEEIARGTVNGCTVIAVGQEDLHCGRIDMLHDTNAPNVGLAACNEVIRIAAEGLAAARATCDTILDPGVFAVEHGVAEARPVLGDTTVEVPHGGVGTAVVVVLPDVG